MGQEIVGPRVSVDRNGTADRGGGQLVIKQEGLFVRTRSLDRLLGVLSAIDHVQLVDLGRKRAQVCFVDGQIWNVHSERGEDLTAFFRQVEAMAGRALLREPPRLADLVRAAATPSRTRAAGFIALALLAYLPLRWLGGLARPLGLVLAAAGVLGLALGVLSFLKRDQDVPLLLRRVRPLISWPWFVAALVVALAGTIGFSDAAARAAREDEQARARAEAARRAEQAEARKRAEARARREEADALAEQLVRAMDEKRYRDAKRLHDRIEALVPQHPATRRVAQELGRALLALDERQRASSVAKGISLARAVASDRLACETAKRVADAHALLRGAREADANYEAAKRALDSLERCRKRIRARFAQSAEEGRRSRRVLAAAQVEAAIRRLGYPVQVTLAGRAANVLRIEARELNAEAAERILALQDGKDEGFEAARTEEGFARVELRGEKFAKTVKLKPQAPSALIVPVLERFGLAEPLAFEEAAP